MSFFYPRLTLRKHTYYIRVQIPKHLSGLARKKNIIYSLRTKDYFEALKRVRKESCRVDMMIEYWENEYRKMKIDNNRIFLNQDEIKILLIDRWVKILKDLEKYEKDIQKGKVGYEKLSFYHPDELSEYERVVINEMETPEGELITTQTIIPDVWDGYKEREPHEEYSLNPTTESMIKQLYKYVASVLSKRGKEGRDDSRILDILAENPNALPYFSVKNEKLKDDEEEESGFLGFNQIFAKMRESEEVLFYMIEDMQTGGNHRIPLYFENIISVAKDMIRSGLREKKIEPKQLDYSKLMENWSENQRKRGVSLKTISSQMSKAWVVIELLRGKKIAKLIKKDIKKLEEELLQVPKNRKQKYPGKTVLEVLECTKGKDISRLSDTTVRDYMGCFNNFVSYLVEEDVLDKNPLDSYTYKYAKASRESYLPFTDEELAIIFNPKTYPPLVISNCGDASAAYFWVPLLALFLGSRLNELCQLDVSDVQTIQGIPCLSIAPDTKAESKNKAAPKKTKTGKRRINPIPQKLIELGFLEYVSNRKKDNCEKLFELSYNKQNGYGDKVGKWFGKYLDKINIVSPQKVFHSFRHLLTQTTNNMNYDSSYAIEIGGWSKNDGSAFSHYCNGQIAITKLKEFVDNMNFETVDFAALKNRKSEDILFKPRIYRRSVLGNKAVKSKR